MPKIGEKTIELAFPVRGVDISVSEDNLQPQTSPDLLNVRPFDFKDRARGGSRPPIRRLYPEDAAANPTARGIGAAFARAEEPVQAVTEVYGVEFTGLNETETTTKAITVVYVVGGYLYRLDWDVEADTKTVQQIGLVSGPTANVTLAVDGPLVYIMADDVTPAYTDDSTQTVYHKYFNALDNTLNNWELDTHVPEDASSPSWPGVPLDDPNSAFSVDGNGDDNRTLVTTGSFKGFFPTTPTKIVTKWGRRLVLAGFADDEQNIICSARGDSFDFEWRPNMVSKYLEENVQIAANNADFTTQVAAYNARLSAALGPEPGSAPTFTYTQHNYNGTLLPIAAPNATGDSFNEKVARSVCQNNLNALNAAIANSSGSYVAPLAWQNPDDSMRSATLESRAVAEYTKDLFPLRYTETTDDVEIADRGWSARHSDVGLVPDEIVNLIPYDETILLVVCKSSVWELNGGEDLSRAKLRPVTRVVGGTEGNSWVIDPGGDVYIVGSDKGFYRLRLQERPERIDYPIEYLTGVFDKSEGRWTVVWDDQEEGCYFHGWDGSNTLSLFYSARTQGWFVDEMDGDILSKKVQCGASIHAKTGTARDNERFAVWGSRDGELYYTDNTYSGDYRDEIQWSSSPNTAPINSFVYLGPYRDENNNDLRCKRLKFELDDDSSAVEWFGFAADSAAQASTGDIRIRGEVIRTRTKTDRQRMTGKALYVYVKQHPEADSAWALDTVRMTGEIRSPLHRRT